MSDPEWSAEHDGEFSPIERQWIRAQHRRVNSILPILEDGATLVRAVQIAVRISPYTVAAGGVLFALFKAGYLG